MSGHTLRRDFLITNGYGPFGLLTKKPGDSGALNGVQINNSNYGNPLPIVYGQGRIGSNLIWYSNFQSHGQEQGGKGGGGVVTYNYTADVMFAVCEGTALDIITIYKNQGLITNGSSGTPLAQEGLTFSNGAADQPIWSYLESNYPAQALAYAGTCWVGRANMALDSSAGIPNYNFEVAGILQYGSGIVDASPADVIADLLTNPRYGAGFPASSIADLTYFRNYCIAADFFISPVLDSQQAVQQFVGDWLTRCNSAPIWSQGQLKIIPYGDMQLTGNSVTWVPNNETVADLNDDDFIGDNSQDALQVQRISPSDAYNDFKLEYLDRSNNYNSAIVEAMDQAGIDLYGIRSQGQGTAHEICLASRAQSSVQLLLQRSIYVRNTYTFTLPVQYCYLEPMDLVTITQTDLGYDHKVVRITQIQEDDNFDLQVTAEDWFLGIGTVIASPTEPTNPYMLPANSIPGSVSVPALFIAPPSLTNGANQVWMALAGTDPNWGGCQIWASFDGSTYTQIGQQEGRSTYGSSTATFPSGSNPDTVNTLSVDMSASTQTLDPVSTSIADAGGSQCWIGGEVIDYTAVTLTSADHYDLDTYIVRGQAGTTIASHAGGSDFALLNGNIFKYSFNNSSIGATLYLKFVSFNGFGNQLEDISTVTVYSIVLVPSSAQNEITDNFDVSTYMPLYGPYTLSQTPAGPVRAYFDGALQPSSAYSISPGSKTLTISASLVGVTTVTAQYNI